MDLKDPNTLNLYQYVKGNPLKYVDYSGHESIGEPKSYLERTLDMVILGSYTDEFTWLGLGLQFLLGLTGIDVACDIRDLTADVTVNRDMTSLSWYGTMLLDIVALVPVIGGLKYLDDLAAGTKSIVKNSDELIDGGKRMARAADALHDLSKKGRTVLNDMADTLRGMSKKVVKNADILNDAKYVDDFADAASDMGKKLDDLADVASDAGKKLDDLAGGGADIDFYVGPNGKALPSQYKNWIGTNKQNELLSQADNPQLQNAIKQLYRENSFIGDGGTADIIRFEQQTGLMLGKNGGSHLQKGMDMAKYIENKILTQDLSPSDRALATQLLEDLNNVLGR